MTRIKKPLARAGQADQQGVSNNYPQDTLFIHTGQAEESIVNSAASKPINLLLMFFQVLLPRLSYLEMLPAAVFVAFIGRGIL